VTRRRGEGHQLSAYPAYPQVFQKLGPQDLLLRPAFAPGKKAALKMPSAACAGCFQRRPSSMNSKTATSSSAPQSASTRRVNVLTSWPQPRSSQIFCYTSNVTPSGGQRADEGSAVATDSNTGNFIQEPSSANRNNFY